MKQKILIVDDEANIRYIFMTLLRQEGYDVITAEDSASAMDIVTKTDLDAILLDIFLGEASGLDILRQVKKQNFRCPVIMITGEPNLDTATEAVRIGAFDYLIKPVQKKDLFRVTTRAVQHKNLLDEKARIEKEKERYRHNLEAIFQSVSDAIVTVNDKMEIIEANEATEVICGFSPKKAVGKQFSKVSGSCNKSCEKVLTETLNSRNIVREYRVECGHEDRPGQVVLLTSSLLADAANRHIGAVLVIRDVTRLTNLEKELRERHQFHNIIGKNSKMQKVYQLVEDLADAETTVLVTGESGTGKELVAKALHYGGLRGSKALVSVNCSALSENLLESELFGHVKGAFTGAINDKAGRFQIANEGSIFLDEIGEISPRIQLKLLRVLQEREFEKVGDSKSIKLDVRIIAATNVDLKEKVRLGEFREDLYYRLKVVDIGLPPLRERRDDIPLLVQHFLRIFRKQFKKHIEGLSDDVMTTLLNYQWPGNVRELENVIEHACAICRERTIMIEHLPNELKSGFESRELYPENVDEDEPGVIVKALNKSDWNKAKAARILGISRQTIYRKIKEYNLNRPVDRR